MKIDYRDYLDDDFYDDLYDSDESYRQDKPRKFKDTDRASAGNNKNKKNIRKKRQAKQKQRKNEEYNQREEF